MRGILSAAPFDLVDLLFYLKGFQIIELGLVGLELGMELVFAGLLLPWVLVHAAAGFRSHDCCPSTLEEHTVSFLSNSTTLPPLSPVAR